MAMVKLILAMSLYKDQWSLRFYGWAERIECCHSAIEQLTDYRTEVRVTRIEQGVGISNWLMDLHLKLNCFRWCQFICTWTSFYWPRCHKQAAISCAIKTSKPHQHVKFSYLLDLWHICQWRVWWKWLLAVNCLDTARWLCHSALSDVEFMQLLTRESQWVKCSMFVQEHSSHLRLVTICEGWFSPNRWCRSCYFAGQGVNIGCLDAAVLCDCMI